MQSAHNYLALGAEAANLPAYSTFSQNTFNLPLLATGDDLNDDMNDPTDKSTSGSRRRRQLVPTEQKDDGYWNKRKKNNEAARRSREKRRANDMMLERRLGEMQKENAGLKAQLYALQLRYGEVNFQNNHTSHQNINQSINQNLSQNLSQNLTQNINQNLNQNINQNLNQNISSTIASINQHQSIQQNLQQNNINQDQIAHQHAHTQAMAAAASAAAAAYHIKNENVGPPAKKIKMIPEVTLPNGRKMLLDSSDSEKDCHKGNSETEAEVLAKTCMNPNQPIRMSSPSPSESSSAQIIVDEEDVDVVTPPVTSGVSSDNESNTNSNTTKSSRNVPEKDAAAQLAAAQAAAQASGLVPITVTNNQPVYNKPVNMMNQDSNVTEQLTEYYKQQFAAIYAQQQAQVASGQTTMANAQNLLPTLQGTTTAATQLAINLLKQNSVSKMWVRGKSTEKYY